MELIDTYEKDDTIDCFTFVFDEVNPDSGYYTMLAMSQDGYKFSQWTSGLYDPEGQNEHLGRRITLQDLGSAALTAFFSRLSIPDAWEPVYKAVEQMIRDEEDGDARTE